MSKNRSSQGISSVQLAQLLSGEKPSRAIPDAQTVSIEECVGEKCYAFLDHNIPRANLPVPYHFKAFIPAIEKYGLLFGVRLGHPNRWDVTTYSMFAEDALAGPAYEINERWVQNLKQLFRNAILPLFTILDRPFLEAFATQTKNNSLLADPVPGKICSNFLMRRWRAVRRTDIHTKILDEIAMWCRQDNGQYFFAPKSEVILEWIISCEWGSWDERGASEEMRFEELNLLVEPSVCLSDFLRLVSVLSLKINKRPCKPYKPSNAASKKSRHEYYLQMDRLSLWDDSYLNDMAKATRDGRERTELLDILNTLPFKDRTEMISRLKIPYKPDVARAMGLSTHRCAYADVFPTGKIASTNIFIERYWWWREIYPEINTYKSRKSHLCEFTISVFKDNWERSAFIYEMRARISTRMHWDFFGKPWIELNPIERSIISILWPPTHIGAYKFRDRSYIYAREDKTTDFELNEAISLLAPNSVIEKQIIWLVKGARLRKGIPEPGRGRGSPKPPPWRALEFLDLNRFSKNIGLSSSDHNSITNAMKYYHHACSETGIEP